MAEFPCDTLAGCDENLSATSALDFIPVPRMQKQANTTLLFVSKQQCQVFSTQTTLTTLAKQHFGVRKDFCAKV